MGHPRPEPFESSGPAPMGKEPYWLVLVRMGSMAVLNLVKYSATLVERAKAIEDDPAYLYGFSRIVVFGSFLADKPKLGDIDRSA